MKTLLAHLNAKIIQFAQRAATWYKQSKAKHFVNAMLRPSLLLFKDIMEDVSDISIKIDRLALNMAMAELRETRLELETIRHNQQVIHEVAVDTRKVVEGSKPKRVSS